MLRKSHIDTLQEQLLARKKELLLETTESKELINELMSESASDDADFAEISSDSFNMTAIRNKQMEELQDINLALNKIDDGTYGVCDMCDEQIGLPRLKIKPHARFCIHCRPIYEKSLKEN
jgi:DnaK suppressor protein